MASRQFTVSFNIQGALDGSFQAALNAAAHAFRGLGQSARALNAAATASRVGLQGMASSLNQLSQMAQKYKAAQDALKQTTADFAKSTAALESARAKYDADAAAVERLKQKIKDLRAEQQKTANKKAVQSEGLKVAQRDLQALKRAYDIAARAGNTAQMRSLDAQIKSTEAAIQRQAETVKKLAQAYKECQDKIKQTRADLKTANDTLKTSGQDLSAARRNAESYKASLNEQLAALGRLKSQLSAAGFNVSNFAASEARLEAEINRVNAALRQQEALTAASARTRAAFTNVGLAAAGVMGSVYSAQQAMSPFKDATETAMGFEHAMKKVEALTQMRNIRAGDMERARSEMAMLRQEAERLGATTEFTSQEIAEAEGFYGMAGWDATKIKNALQHTVDLATIADDHNIQRMADVLSDDMTAMGLKAGETLTLANGKIVEQSKYFADAFAYGMTNANVNRESLHEALKYNAPIAKQWGLTMGETFAINMMSANAGIKGSMAGTGLRAGLLRMAAPPKKAQAAFAEMGLSASDAQREIAESHAAMQAYGVTVGDFATTLRSLKTVFDSLDKKEQLGFTDAVFGKNASSFWTNILSSGNVEDVLKAAEEIDLGWVEDYASDTARIMRDDTKTAVEVLKSSIDALQRSIGEALTPAIRSAAEAFAPMVTAAGEWIKANPAIVQGAAAIVASLSGLMVAAAGVKLAFAGWSFITAQVALVRAALATLADGALLGGLTARLAAIRAAMFGIGGAATIGGWSAMFAAISTKAAAAATAIKGFFASLTLGSAASGALTSIKAIGTAIAGAARAALAFAFSPVGAALMALALAGLWCYQNWDRVSPVLERLASTITGALSSALQTIQPAIQKLMAAFDGLAGNGAFQALIDSLGMLATGALATVASAVVGILATIINVAAQIISTVANVITGIVNLITNVLNGDWSAAWSSMGQIATSVLEGIGNVAKAIFNGIADTVKTIGDAWNYLRGKPADKPHASGGGGGENFDAHKTGGGGGGDFDAPKQQATQSPAIVQQESPTIQQPAPIIQQDAPVVESPKVEVHQDAPQVEVPEINVPKIEMPPQQPTVTKVEVQAAAMQNISQPQINVGPFQSALDNAANSANNAAPQFQNVATSSQVLSTANSAATGIVQALTAGMTTATGSVQNLGTSSQTAAGGATSLGNAAAGAAGGTTALGNAAAGAAGGTSALGGAAAGASGSVSGLGSAAQSAIAALSAAAGSAASAAAGVASSIASMVANVPVAANYQGGIYRKGAFLTTFAEKSAEAAIPLDGSQRAKDLWTRAGEMLGILPNTGAVTFDPTITSPPFNPDIKLPDGRQIYSGSRQLPSREKTRRQKLPEIFTAPPTLPERIRQPKPQAKLPKLGFPTTTPPFVPTQSNASPLTDILKVVGGKLLDKLQSTKFGQILGNIFPTGVDQTTRWSPYQSSINLPTMRPTFNPKLTTPPFAPIENNSSTTLERIIQTHMTTPPFVPESNYASPIAQLHETLAKPDETLYRDDAPITIEINVTVNGNADESTVRRGIEQAMPTVRNFADELRRYRHERERVSFK